MDLESLVGLGLANGASDLHLEAGLPPALRVRGALRTVGQPLPSKLLLEMARGRIEIEPVEGEFGKILKGGGR